MKEDNICEECLEISDYCCRNKIVKNREYVNYLTYSLFHWSVYTVLAVLLISSNVVVHNPAFSPSITS